MAKILAEGGPMDAAAIFATLPEELRRRAEERNITFSPSKIRRKLDIRVKHGKLRHTATGLFAALEGEPGHDAADAA